MMNGCSGAYCQCRRCTAVTGRGFTSAFAARLEEYVEFKAAWASRSLADLVLEAVRRLLRRTRPECLDRDTVQGWVTAQLSTSGRYRSWMSYIRDFGRWLGARGCQRRLRAAG